MAVTAHMFSNFVNQMGTKTVNLSTDPCRVILATAATTGIAAAQNTVTTVTSLKAVTGWTEVANAAGGSNYVQNANSHLSGQALSSVTWTQSGLVWTFTSANPSWTTAGAGFAPAYAIFIDDIGATDATNFPICWWDLGGAQAGTGGNYTLTVAGTGIFTATNV
jgi:hypothetical protein